MRVSATHWSRSGAGAPPAPEHTTSTAAPISVAAPRSRFRGAVQAAGAAAAVPALLFLLPSAGSAAAADRAPQPELGLDVCADLGVVTVDLGCPTEPTTPPATSPPATSPPATSPPATTPPATEPPPALDLPDLPVVPDVTVLPVLPSVPLVPLLPSGDVTTPVPLIDDLEVDTPIVECNLATALLAATADCNLAVVAALLPSGPELPSILGLDLNALLDVPLGVASAEGIVDTDGGLGGDEGLTGDLCLDAAALAPTDGACPEARGIAEPMSLAVVDNCIDVAVLAELPAECAVPDGGGGAVDADTCAGVDLADVLTPQGCAQADVLAGVLAEVLAGEEAIDVCAAVDVAGDATDDCAPPPTTTPGTTATTPGAGPGTAGGSDGTTPGGGAGPADPGGGPGARPARVERASGSLPMTGIAVAGTLVAGVALVVTGAGTRLLARIPSRR